MPRHRPNLISKGKISRWRSAGCWLLLITLWIGLGSLAIAATPRNIILFIGDGMGAEQVKAASLYLYGTTGGLAFESFPHQARVKTHSADSPITDSAAASTAIATGFKVNNQVISMAIPGDGRGLPTLLEILGDKGKATGLVTTTSITHATPAAFGAHEQTRANKEAIAQEYLTHTRPNLLFGGGGHGISVSQARSAGYRVVSNRAGMQDLEAGTPLNISGQFGDGHMPYEYDHLAEIDMGYEQLPHLSEMTRSALTLLAPNPEGFFLMVEGGRIDHAGHKGETRRMIFEVIEFEQAIEVALDWAQGRHDTLIIVTADHETGGLSVLDSNGPGRLPTVAWSTTKHTGANVPIYAMGHSAELVTGIIDNTDIFHIITGKRLPRTDIKVNTLGPVNRP